MSEIFIAFYFMSHIFGVILFFGGPAMVSDSDTERKNFVDRSFFLFSFGVILCWVDFLIGGWS